MGQLYDAKIAIQDIIARKGLDAVRTNGTIGLKAGVLLALVNKSTPDDPARIEKLIAAAKDVLGEEILEGVK